MFTRREAEEVGRRAGQGEGLGDVRVAAKMREFREKFGYRAQSAVIRATGINQGMYSRLERALTRPGTNTLSRYLIGTFELIMATQPSRKQEYWNWIYHEFLPAIYEMAEDNVERRKEAVERNRAERDDADE